eukprot:678756-Rhodomonas_salina.2
MRRLHKVSLAIGDGGNDVPMIQSADVGIGIMGHEGMQASRSSDFSIGEFRLLKRLLAVHGRYSSLRMSDLIKFSFYKNVCFCTPQVIFAAYSLYSANTIHNEWIILAFNIFFTGMQPLMFAVFEKDLDEDVIELFPEAYSTEERKHPLTPWQLFGWESQAVFQGTLFAFAALYGMSWDTAYDASGRVAGLDSTGFMLAAMVVWVITVKLCLMLRYFTFHHINAIWTSVLAFYIALLLLNIWTSDFAGVGINGVGVINQIVLSKYRSWMLLLVFVFGAAIPDVVTTYAQRTFFPMAWQTLQSVDRYRGREKLKSLSYKYQTPAEPESEAEEEAPLIDEDRRKDKDWKLNDIA